MSPYWRDRSADGYLDAITRFALIVDERDTVVGWTGYHLRDFGSHPCLYIDSTGILPELQSKGLVSSLQARLVFRELVRHPTSTMYLVTRTESPIVYRAFRSGFGEAAMHPAPGRTPPKRVRTIGRDVATWLRQAAAFDSDQLKLVGAYSNLDALYGELPSTGDEPLDSFFRTNLTPLDAFLVIVEASVLPLLRYRLWRFARSHARARIRSPQMTPTT